MDNKYQTVQLVMQLVPNLESINYVLISVIGALVHGN